MIETHNYARQPFEISFLIGGAITGGVQVFTDIVPPSIEYMLSPAWQTAWAVLFCLSSVAALVGITIRDEVVGLFWESFGLFGVTFTAWAYSYALFYRVDFSSAYQTGSIFFIYGVACAWRWAIIRRVIRKAKKVTYDELER